MSIRLLRAIVAAFLLGCAMGRPLPAQQPGRAPVTADDARLLRAVLSDGTLICDTGLWIRDGAGFQLLSKDGRRTALHADSIRALWLSAPGARPMSSASERSGVPAVVIGSLLGMPLMLAAEASASGSPKSGSMDGIVIVVGLLAAIPATIIASFFISKMTESEPPGWRLLPEYGPPRVADEAKALFAQVSKACR